MTKLQIAVLSGLAAAAAVWLIQQPTQSRLREENEALRRALDQGQRSAAESAPVPEKVAPSAASQSQTNDQFRELIKLRGEVGRLRQEVQADSGASASGTNREAALSGFTANPEMRKVIRDQQKAGLSMVYKDFAKRAKLSKEQSEKLNDLLADNVMQNIEHITKVLREKMDPGEMARVFAEQEAAAMNEIRTLLEPEAVALYEDYNKNLLSHLTAEQFKGLLKGDKATVEAQTQQLYTLLQEESKGALDRAGLAPHFQLVPTLNFLNIASEQTAENNLRLLEEVYSRTASRASGFLSAEELQKFTEFQAKAVNGNRMAIGLNRKMMAPGAP